VAALEPEIAGHETALADFKSMEETVRFSQNGVSRDLHKTRTDQLLKDWFRT